MTVNFISTLGVPKFSFLKPDPYDILISDIAHALSLTCRFGGHSNVFYSVAEHSIIVAEILEREGVEPLTVLAGMLHDAEEAYLPDVCSPIKAHLTEFRTIEKKLQAAIIRRFQLYDIPWEHIKAIDKRICVTEAKALGIWNKEWEDVGDPLPFKLHLWTSDVAERLFLANFVDLSEKCYEYTLRS